MPLDHRSSPGRNGGGAGDLRQGNLTKILHYVRDHGASSRHDVAHGCGLGISTMTDLVGELRSRGLVRELEAVRRPGAGRPTKPIALDGDVWCVVGVQIDMREVSLVCTTVGGRELWREHVPVPLQSSGPERGYALFHDVLSERLLRIPRDKTLVSVQIGLPGYVAGDSGTISRCPTLGWDGLPLQTAVSDTVRGAGWENVTVGIEHDGHLAALHAVREELPGPVPPVAVYLGGIRELNGGMVMDGQIFRGADGGAGDLGHVRVDPAGDKCPCGRQGCLETVLGPQQLLVRSGLASEPQAERLVTLEPHRAQQMLLERGRDGDPSARSALETGGRALQVALDGVVGIVNPHTVILGGFLGALRPLLGVSLQQGTEHRIAVGPFARTALVALDRMAPRVFLGAGLAARDACLQDPLHLTHVL
jgi:predicted NBD/HSP70 family sugar kinase